MHAIGVVVRRTILSIVAPMAFFWIVPAFAYDEVAFGYGSTRSDACYNAQDFISRLEISTASDARVDRCYCYEEHDEWTCEVPYEMEDY